MSAPTPQEKIGTLSALSIGIGGMVGGGIFAVTGLTIAVTKGAAPVAFAIAGIVALLTSYSYLKLTLAYPGEGGTVDFLNRAFGGGVFTGAANILLLLSYVVLVAVYAYAFGSYAADLFPSQDQAFWQTVLTNGVIVGLLAINVFASRLVLKSENLFNLLKMVLLVGFIVVGLASPMDWSNLNPVHAVSPTGLVAGAMLIFLNYEGFELIANASKDIENPRKSLPIAYIGGVVIAIVLYVLIVAVVLGHMSLEQISASQDTALSAAGRVLLGPVGYYAIVVAAIMATSSAINATFFSTGRLTYIVAKTGQLPKELERSIWGEHAEGTVICAIIALAVANFAPLEAIATMGSAGFLILFFLVNMASVRLARDTGANLWVSLLAAVSTAAALVILCVTVAENPATENHLWILVGMIAFAAIAEAVYRGATGRHIHLHPTSPAPKAQQSVR
ncbi:MAG: APC family permease [Marinosulfonomonas sp.]